MKKEFFYLMGLSLVFIAPSLGQAVKFLGMKGAALYGVLVPAVIFISFYLFKQKFLIVSRKQGMAGFLLMMFFLVFLFFWLYPLANSGRLGPGSDRDEGLNLAVHRLLQGHHPYSKKTYLDNPINTFPGQMLLAIPFVILGNSAYQNFFWGAVLFFFYAHLFSDLKPALLAFVWTFFLCLEVMREWVTGGSLFCNVIYVTLFSFFALEEAIKQKRMTLKSLLLFTVFGISLSSRLNFLLILPILFSCLLKECGLRRSVVFLLASIAAFFLVTLPLYIYDPARFMPLATNDVFQWLDPFWPGASRVAPVLCAVFSIILAFVPIRNLKIDFFTRSALVQFFPVILLVALPIFFNQPVRWERLGYGLNFLIFGACAFCLKLSQILEPRTI